LINYEPCWKNIHSDHAFTKAIFNYQTGKNVAGKQLRLYNVARLDDLRMLPDQFVAFKRFNISILWSFWSMETTAKVNPFIEVFLAIIVKVGHWTAINLNAGCCGARCVIRPGTFLVVALETASPLGSTIIAFEIESGFINMSHIAHFLVRPFGDKRLDRVLGAHAMSLLAVVCR
jgi:hypothetical protein